MPFRSGRRPEMLQTSGKCEERVRVRITCRSSRRSPKPGCLSFMSVMAAPLLSKNPALAVRRPDHASFLPSPSRPFLDTTTRNHLPSPHASLHLACTPASRFDSLRACLLYTQRHPALSDLRLLVLASCSTSSSHIFSSQRLHPLSRSEFRINRSLWPHPPRRSTT